jgi:hypothetical protein
VLKEQLGYHLIFLFRALEMAGAVVSTIRSSNRFQLDLLQLDHR